MANPHPALNVTSAYDAFLFAPIGIEQGGMRLSMLSALARMNLDPWDEAARLAKMSSPDAQKTLVATLNGLPGQRRSSPETEALAARLVALLPKARVVTTANAATIAGVRESRMSYWLVWLCIAIVMSFLWLHQRAPTTGPGNSASTSNAAAPAESRGAERAASAASGRPDSDEEIPQTVPSAGSTAR